ncbi:MAG: cytochrome P450, partial [Actinophytocola sp.]|nr:cytochrome P450 [Actinophytocola sp.]
MAARLTGREALRLLPTLRADPLIAISELTRAHGDLVRVPLPRGNQLVLTSRPALVAHVLVSNQDNYRKARTYRPLTEVLGNGLLTNEGESWARQRRLVQPMFARRRIDAFAPAMVDAASTAMDRWAALGSGSVVDVADEMSALTLDVVGRALFSTELSGEASQMAPALETVLESFVKVVRHPLFMLVPDYHRWPTPSRLRARGAERHLRSVVDGLITSRRAGVAGSADADLLDALLSARDDDGNPLDEQQIRDELMTFLLAGHETTANALAWTLLLLSRHPDARDR